MEFLWLSEILSISCERQKRERQAGLCPLWHLTLHCTWSPLPGLCLGHSLHFLSACLDSSSTIKFRSKKPSPWNFYQENPLNSDLIILSGGDSFPKVPEYSSKILGSLFSLFSLQCITQCQMHNGLSTNICWRWKGGRRREEIKRRKTEGERETERMNQLLYARIPREEPAPPPKDLKKKHTPILFSGTTKPHLWGFLFLSMQI